MLSSLTLVSRLLGFVRDLLTARLFGTGMVADAFVVALRIPNLLRSLVAEGALTSAFVPVFAEQLKLGREQAQQALSELLSFLLAVNTLLIVVGLLFAPQITAFFAPGFLAEPAKFELCYNLLRIMFPLVLCVSWVALLSAALNSLKVFGASAIAQIVMNLALIVGALAAPFLSGHAAHVLAWSVIIGGVLEIAVQIPALKRAGLSLHLARALWSPRVAAVVKLMLPAILGAAVYQLGIFINTVFASWLEQGSVAWLFYADRLTQLPIGVFSIALASVLLPALSHASASGQSEQFSKHLMNALRVTSFVMLPLAALLATLAHQAVGVLFERGAFDANSTYQTALAVQAYALGLWGVSCHSMAVRAFIARKDTKTPTKIALFMLLVSTAGAWLLMQQLGHVGLALASSISATAGFLLAALVLNRTQAGLFWGPFISTTFKSAAAAALAVAAIQIAASSLKLAPLLQLITLGILGVAVFVLVGAALKIPELREVMVLARKAARR